MDTYWAVLVGECFLELCRLECKNALSKGIGLIIRKPEKFREPLKLLLKQSVMYPDISQLCYGPFESECSNMPSEFIFTDHLWRK